MIHELSDSTYRNQLRPGRWIVLFGVSTCYYCAQITSIIQKNFSDIGGIDFGNMDIYSNHDIGNAVDLTVIPCLVAFENGQMLFNFKNLKNKTDFFIFEVLTDMIECFKNGDFSILENRNQTIQKTYIDFVKKSVIRDNSLIVDEYSDFLKTVNIESVVLSCSLVESKVFYGNDNLTRAKVVNCEYIPDSCFEKCGNLHEVVISPDVKHIGKCSFQYCVNLEKVVFEGDDLVIDDYAFYGCPRITKKQFASKKLDFKKKAMYNG